MSGQEDKNQKTKSKIEQIREELEKKLAAIEKAKTAPQSEAVAVDKEVIAKEIEAIKEEAKIVDKKNDLVFEISDKIEDVKEDISTKIENVETELNDAVTKNVVEKNVEKASTTIEKPVKVEKEVSKLETLKEIIKSETNISVNKTTENSNKTIIPPPKTVKTAIHTNQQKPSVTKKVVAEEKEEDFVTYVEEKPKKKSNYLLYALLLLLFGGIAYLLVNYLNQNKAQQKIIMDQKLSEFKNKRYLDSIELADLNGQLLDLQSKKMIDSLDQIYEQELLAKSKFKNKNDIKRNFNVDGSEITSNSKKNTNKNSIKTNIISQSAINSKVSKASKGRNTASKASAVPSKESDSNTSSVETDQAKGDENSVVKNEDSKNDDTKTENKKEQEVAQSKETPKEVEKNQPKVVKVPVYPGCEKKKSELDRKKCLINKMYRNISRHFNTELAQNIGLKSGKHVVRVNFIIDKSGYATVLNVRAENKILEDEAIRVVQALPKMRPGTINGKRAKIQYNIPIRYIVGN